MDKIINTHCICKRSFSHKHKLLILQPCEHLIHLKCTDSSITKCPYCTVKISQVMTYDYIKNQVLQEKNAKYYQLYVDITAVYNLSQYGEVNRDILIDRMPLVLKEIPKLFKIKQLDDINYILYKLLKVGNIYIKIRGQDKLNNENKIYISNHCSNMDPAILYLITKCGFIASDIITEAWFLKDIIKIFPLLLIKRGSKNNTVNKMAKYVSKKGSLCLFPEGFMTHQNTLSTFRTGAFMANQPVQPIIIKYSPYIYDWDYNQYLYKIFSQDKITITVTIMDVEYPPFTPEKISQIRNKMANVGNLALSRLSNKDIIDN